MSSWFHRHRDLYPTGWTEFSRRLREEVGQCEACWCRNGPGGRRLSVDHVDGNQSNCRRSNLMVLCSRCHMLKWHLPAWLGREEILLRLRRRIETERAQLEFHF